MCEKYSHIFFQFIILKPFEIIYYLLERFLF